MDASQVAEYWRIPDELWETIRELIPEHVNTHRFGGGRPRADDRVCMDAILFVLRTGCQWKALDATKFCPGSTAHDRFQEWVREGVFQNMWDAGLMAYQDLKGLDWSWLSMDGCLTKAPLGGEKDRQKPDGSREAWCQRQPAGRGRWHSSRRGGGRRQSQRYEVDARNVGEYSRRRRTPQTNASRAARIVLGQRL